MEVILQVDETNQIPKIIVSTSQKTPYFEHLVSSPSFVAKFETPLDALTVAIMIWGAMGVVFFFSHYIFLLEKLSITQQTIYHFIATYCGYTLLALCAGWFPNTLSWFIFYTGIFVLVYCIIWYVSMTEAKKLTAELNVVLISGGFLVINLPCLLP
ncbi:DUF3021 domain-containing protein [Leuconostoc holzapfelii]|nr:DUF3021 domain-containing protein [Leuconostoc holzapfelii]